VTAECVLEESIAGGIATLTMNRPHALNALSDALFESLRETFTRLDGRSDVGVILLTGNGRAFCAGGDVNEMPGNSTVTSPAERIAALRRRAAVIQLLADSSKLTVAAINGIAYGAGFALALACDFRIASRTATFTTGYINMGFSGDCGAIHLLTNLVGAAKAKELFFLSDPLSTDDASRLGLLTKCVDAGDLTEESRALARRLADGPRVAQRYMKQNFRNVHMPLSEFSATESAYLILTACTEDHAEAKRAFREKRPAHFKGS
jgi:2-(1,2-epoxy-1,2-dihydrophenyl)acetyl-CoA isomerase